MELRDYQKESVVGIRKGIRDGKGNGIVVLPTGGGKTPVASLMAKRTQDGGKRVLFIAHTRELIEQAAKHLRSAGCDVGIIMAGFTEDRSKPVQVCSIQTLARRELPDADVVMIDECHHVRATTYARVIREYERRNAIVIGFTATPQRLDGKGLGEFFGFIVEPTTVRELIEREFLSDYRYYAPSIPDLTGIKKVGGDYSKRGINGVMNKSTITGDIVKHYRRLFDSGQAMVFASGIAHSMAICEAFREAGISSAHLDGTIPAKQRKETMDAFRNGEIRVLSNCALFGEGVDVPNMRGVILARPTTSFVVFRQQVGRALRVCEGKPNAIIADHSGNYLRHGMPDDVTEWDLEDRKNPQDSPKYKQCKRCFAVVAVGASTCPHCGYHFRSAPRKGPEFKDGDLTEVKKKKYTKEMKRALYDAILTKARTKGYRRGWASREYKRETKVWPRGFADLVEKHNDQCQHVRLDDATERCRFCGVYCGR